MNLQISVKKYDEDRRVVYGEVYPPDRPDADNEFMTQEQIIDMAHRFFVGGGFKNIDTEHDNVLNGSMVVESWIEQNPSGIYIEGAWVVGIYVENQELWDGILSGEYNGFSMEAMVVPVDRIVEFEIPEVLEGTTIEADGHTHQFFVKYAEDGTYLGGDTDVVNGHKHKIVRGTVTNTTDGHSHRYSVSDLLPGLEIVE